MLKEEKNSLSLIAIVAIVAVVALIVLSNGNITGESVRENKKNNDDDKDDDKREENDDSCEIICPSFNSGGSSITTESIDYVNNNCTVGEWCMEEVLFSRNYTKIPMCEVFQFQDSVWEQRNQCFLNVDLTGVIIESIRGMRMKILVFE